jgi:hypothetical protein
MNGGVLKSRAGGHCGHSIVRCCLMFVSSQYGSCLMTTFLHLVLRLSQNVCASAVVKNALQEIRKNKSSCGLM